VTAQQPFVMGSQAVEAALNVLDGKPVDKNANVAVLGLNRADPAAVQTYKDELKKLK
jgi:ABC-type sugar transport system substrate-binding protein